MPAGDISVRAYPHPNWQGRWITITITVAGTHDLQMVVDTGAPASALSPEMANELTDLNLLRPPLDHRYTHHLTSLTAQGQPLPDFDVTLLPRLTRLKIDGLIGLDYLARFNAIHFYVPTLQLVLEDP